MRRVLVCGGRDYANHDRVHEALDLLHDADTIVAIIHGGASGADAFAEHWALTHFDWESIDCIAFPADWKEHGRAAGPIRNARMLHEGKPDLVVAFPGGRGTADCVGRARELGIDVLEVTDEA